MCPTELADPQSIPGGEKVVTLISELNAMWGDHGFPPPPPPISMLGLYALAAVVSLERLGQQH